MGDELKKALIQRQVQEDPQLAVERSLMRLSGAYPEALSVKPRRATTYLDLLDSDAAVHPIAPRTIWYHPGIAGSDQLDTTMAHELEHVRQLGGKSRARNLIELLMTNLQPYSRRQQELDAEKAALGYTSRVKGDIRLPEEQ